MAAAVSREKWLEKISRNNQPQKVKQIPPAVINVAEVKNITSSDALQIMLKELNDRIAAVEKQTMSRWDTMRFVWGEDLTAKVIHCNYPPIDNSLLFIYNGVILTKGDDYMLNGQDILIGEELNPDTQDKFIVHYNYTPVEV